MASLKWQLSFLGFFFFLAGCGQPNNSSVFTQNSNLTNGANNYPAPAPTPSTVQLAPLYAPTPTSDLPPPPQGPGSGASASSPAVCSYLAQAWGALLQACYTSGQDLQQNLPHLCFESLDVVDPSSCATLSDYIERAYLLCGNGSYFYGLTGHVNPTCQQALIQAF